MNDLARSEDIVYADSEAAEVEIKELTPEILLSALERAASQGHVGENVHAVEGILVRLQELEGITWLVPCDLVTPNPRQPRMYFDPVALKRLAGMITVTGQEEEIKVVPYIDGSSVKLFLVDGERRFRVISSAEYLGIDTIKAKIVWKPTFRDIYRASLMINLGREGHTPLEMAEAFQELIDQETARPRNDGKNPIEVVAELMQYSVQTVQQYLGILRVLQECEEGERALLVEFINSGKMPKYAVLNLGNFMRKLEKKGININRAAAIAQYLESAQRGADPLTESSGRGPGNRIRGGFSPDAMAAAQRRLLLSSGDKEAALKLTLKMAIKKTAMALRTVVKSVMPLIAPGNEELVMELLNTQGVGRTVEVLREEAKRAIAGLEQFDHVTLLATKPPPLAIPQGRPRFFKVISSLSSKGFHNATVQRICSELVLSKSIWPLNVVRILMENGT